MAARDRIAAVSRVRERQIRTITTRAQRNGGFDNPSRGAPAVRSTTRTTGQPTEKGGSA